MTFIFLFQLGLRIIVAKFVTPGKGLIYHWRNGPVQQKSANRVHFCTGCHFISVSWTILLLLAQVQLDTIITHRFHEVGLLLIDRQHGTTEA